MAELTSYVDIWWHAVEDFTRLVEELPEDAWHLPTDLPGWDVQAVVAHVAHLEALLAGTPHDDVETPDAPHAVGAMGQFTEQGVVARRGRTRDELVNEIREAATARHTALLADPPTDPDEPAPGLFGALGWSTRTLLRNRPLDIHVHEQDVRRAAGLPGTHDTPQAVHTAGYLLESLPVVVARRAQFPAGSTVVVEVDGHEPVAVEVDLDGRGQVLAAPPSEPTVRLRADRGAYLELAAGRRVPEQDRYELTGDPELGQRLLDHLGVTP